LHSAQVQAYREAALKALREWCQSVVPLEPMEETDAEDAFVERCVAAIANNVQEYPKWNVGDSYAKVLVTMEIRKRAKGVFAKYHPTTTTAEDEEEREAEEGEEGEEGEEVESGEEGEETEEDGEVGDMETEGPKAAEATGPTSNNKSKQPPNQKTNTGAKKRTANKGNTNNKATVRKKGTAAKPAAPNTRAQGARNKAAGGRASRGGGNRGGRGGRGGGNAKSGN
jgi:hypothetical protein